MKTRGLYLILIIIPIIIFCSCEDASPTFVQNEKPKVNAFTTTKDTANWDETVQLAVDVTDKENDKLSYQWEVDKGTFTTGTTSKTVTWKSPSENCTAKFTIKINDGRNETVQSKEIVVKVMTELYVSASSLNFPTYTGLKTFYLENRGRGEMNWSITSDVNWIGDITPSSGTTSTARETINVIVDGGSLNSGTYTGTLTVKNNSEINKEKTISVSMIVPTPAQWLQNDDGSFEYEENPGKNWHTYVGFNMPAGWSAAKVTQIQIYMTSNTTYSYHIRGCDNVFYSDSYPFPDWNSWRDIKTYASQFTGWKTFDVSEIFSSPVFFIAVKYLSDNGPKIGIDYRSENNSTLLSGIYKEGEPMTCWIDAEYGIRVYVEKVSGGEAPVSGAPETPQGIWLNQVSNFKK
ncbi:MAG: hypothetical protein K9I69_05185 [Ignavibacteriales bacterium]|nr:hypothetical protein [Ignavibacteriales bacterium]MCF8306015.1 hypothetical protein [Ignavibacteriales bacterium]MCF8315737.1 hypothetical protein [Ignavibacteriales bacterium]MCF8437069.1 hypothetical protein [Ignavibacteriales bacterium]